MIKVQPKLVSAEEALNIANIFSKYEPTGQPQKTHETDIPTTEKWTELLKQNEIKSTFLTTFDFRKWRIPGIVS